MALGWNGVNLVQLAEDGSNNQKFVLTPRATSAVPEGIYFFQNAELGHYMQIDDDKSITTEGAKFELWGFDGDNDQKWEIDYTADGYYRILSVASGKAVTAPPSGNDKNITQTVYTGGDNQWWSITVTDNGMYNLSPKSNPSYRMAAGDGLSEVKDGRNVELRSPQTDNKDEWILAKIEFSSSTGLEGQQKSNWCWVTSARMFSKHSYPSVTYTQSDAVTYVKGSNVNQTGNRAEAQSAINYYISNINGASINTVVKDYLIYSEDTLVQFLNDGHVIYIARGWYDDINNPNSRIGGHASLIYGYVTIGTEIWFLVRDPLPVNVGETYLISYEKLCNGRNPRQYETSDHGVWYASIVVNTAYAGNTIPYFFNQ